MPDYVTFAVLSLTLLLTPGPTNTLLAVAGASAGLKSWLVMAPAELAGYLIAIHVLAFGIGPLIPAQAQFAVKIACALYLVVLAVMLWRAQTPLIRQEIITPRRVFIVTLLNPKALIFTFVILPRLPGQWLAALPYLAGLCALIVAASLCWIGLGTGLGSGRLGHISQQNIRRTGAVALAVFALVIVTSRATLSG